MHIARLISNGRRQAINKINKVKMQTTHLHKAISTFVVGVVLAGVF
jgi:hypothetical protein